jgi:hypothetical protein
MAVLSVPAPVTAIVALATSTYAVMEGDHEIQRVDAAAAAPLCGGDELFVVDEVVEPGAVEEVDRKGEFSVGGSRSQETERPRQVEALGGDRLPEPGYETFRQRASAPLLALLTAPGSTPAGPAARRASPARSGPDGRQPARG